MIAHTKRVNFGFDSILTHFGNEKIHIAGINSL